MNEDIAVLTDFDPVLYEQAAPPLVSIFLPTSGADGLERDRERFRDLVSEARAELAQQRERREYANLVANLDVVAERFEDYAHSAAQGGLAVLASDERVNVLPLGFPVEERVVVGERFSLKPIMRTFLFGAHYYLLGLSADRFALIHGDFGSLERVELPADVPGEFSEEFPEVYDGHEGALDYSSLENHMPPYHGYKSRNDVKKEEAEKFFRSVNRAVTEHLEHAAPLPVILVSLPEHQAMFRSFSTVPNLLDEGIEKNVDGVDFPELLQDATAVIERAREKRDRAVAEEFGDARAAGKATDDLDAIAFALLERKVRALLVEEEAAIPGVYDEQTGTLTRPADGDLADEFAQATLRQGGEVYLVDPALMPTDAGVAALYRY
ncbi:baeRF8 domain-containing protein [Arabiibacter massiliensis]|uniref:baeRF8 domain-containing protein n=1 Tax=Arabiibacter massiliensis TaxID=1870985 RepID=UPI0009BC2DDB|nr:hypothetical protein [Arabiibacter massiliensis]